MKTIYLLLATFVVLIVFTSCTAEEIPANQIDTNTSAIDPVKIAHGEILPPIRK